MISKNDESNWNKLIIFAPNAAGKTRLSYEIKDNLELDGVNVELMTAKTILDLVDLDRSGIYVGKAAKQLRENSKIEDELKNQNYLKNTIFRDYGVSNATSLRKNSCIFSLIDIKNERLIDFIKKCNTKFDNSQKDNELISYEEAIELDKKFKSDELNFILKIKNDKNVSKILENNNAKNTISKEKYECLEFLKNSLVGNEFVCPLCGYNYETNEVLLKKIENNLNTMIVDDLKVIFDMVDILWNKIINMDNKKLLDKFEIKIGKENSYADKILEILKLENLFETIKATIFNKIKTDFQTIDILKTIKNYQNNSDLIREEKDKIKSQTEYYNNIIVEFEKLVNLPDVLALEIIDDKIKIKNNSTNTYQNPSECLSESEIKRMALSVLKNQIIYANVEYVIFDDPIDSYDDYFLKRASRYIANLINSYSNLKWTVFTHLFELVSILNSEIKNIEYYNKFYFYDPSYQYVQNIKPKLMQCSPSEKNISILKEHEIMIFSKLFNSRKEEHDIDFILLAASNTVRNSVDDVIPIFNISFLRSKVNKKTLNMENRYLHYSDMKNFKMKEFIEIYSKLFKNFLYSNNDIKDCLNEDACVFRESLLCKEYKDIKMLNPLFKTIFYNIIRVSYCKWLIEYKLINRMKKYNYSEHSIETVFRKHGIHDKINSALSSQQIEGKNSDIEEIKKIHDEFYSLTNDFSHATVRMFPPYLSISSYDIAKYEYLIKKLK